MSDYTDEYYGKHTREQDCGILHTTIEDAIIHAEMNLGCTRLPMDPYLGTTSQNQGVVVGWALSPRVRYRLDYSDKAGENGENPKWVHVNEENFEAAPGCQRTVHRVDSKSFILVHLQYRKWESRVGRPRRP